MKNAAMTNNLKFDLELSKKIAAEFKRQDDSADEISKVLVRCGYGDEQGKPFSENSINEWFRKKD